MNHDENIISLILAAKGLTERAGDLSAYCWANQLTGHKTAERFILECREAATAYQNNVLKAPWSALMQAIELGKYAEAGNPYANFCSATMHQSTQGCSVQRLVSHARSTTQTMTKFVSLEELFGPQP